MATNRLLLFVAAVLFVIAAIVVQGAALAGIHAETFALVAFACWVAAGAL